MLERDSDKSKAGILKVDVIDKMKSIKEATA